MTSLGLDFEADVLYMLSRGKTRVRICAVVRIGFDRSSFTLPSPRPPRALKACLRKKKIAKERHYHLSLGKQRGQLGLHVWILGSQQHSRGPLI